MPTLAIEKLKRIMWRLKETYPNAKWYNHKQLDFAIIHEIGYSTVTLANVKTALCKIGWLKRDRRMFQILKKDIY